MTTEFEPNRRTASAGPPPQTGIVTERRSPLLIFGVLAVMTIAILVAILVTNLTHGTSPTASDAAQGVTTGQATAPASPKSAPAGR
jgi:hypothetical protein